MALDVTEEAVDIRTAGTTDNFSAVPSSCQWYIFYDMDGYVFVYDEGGVALTYNPSAGEGATLYCDEYVETDATFQWTVTPLPGSMNGVVFFDDNENQLYATFYRQLEVSQTKTLAELNITTSVYSCDSLSQTVRWESSNPSVATVNETTGTVTTFSSGITTITAYDSTNSGSNGCYTLVVPRYILPFNNYYDQSFDSTLRALIDDAVQLTNSAYAKLFAIGFESSGDAQYDAAATTDDCDYAQCDSRCGNCINHHKNITKVYDHIFNELDRSENGRSVFWTNYALGSYCEYKSIEDDQGNEYWSHVSKEALALTVQYKPSILFMHSAGTDEETHKYCMGIVLAHETAHTFGLEDYYGEDHDDAHGWHCVMEKYQTNYPDELSEFYDGVLSGSVNAFCESCRTNLNEYIEDYIETYLW